MSNIIMPIGDRDLSNDASFREDFNNSYAEAFQTDGMKKRAMFNTYSIRTNLNDNVPFKVHADPRKQVNLRIYPLNDQLSEFRFWCEGKLINVYKVKTTDLEGVHF